jgi:hypothetical protein
MPDPNTPQPELPEELLEEKPLVDRLQSLYQKGVDHIGRGDDRIELRDIILALQAEPVLVVNKGVLIHGVDPDADLTGLTDALEDQFGAIDDRAKQKLEALAAAEKAAAEGKSVGPAAEEKRDPSGVEFPEPAVPLPHPDRLPDPESELPEPAPAFPETLTSDPLPGPEPSKTGSPPPGERIRVTVEEPLGE